jgi:hypothetical protein
LGDQVVVVCAAVAADGSISVGAASLGDQVGAVNWVTAAAGGVVSVWLDAPEDREGAAVTRLIWLTGSVSDCGFGPLTALSCGASACSDRVD